MARMPRLRALVHGREVGEDRFDGFDAVGTIGADQSGGAALDPAGDIGAGQCAIADETAALRIAHDAGALVVFEPGKRQPFVADAAEDEAARQLDLIIARAGNLLEWRAFEPTLCQYQSFDPRFSANADRHLAEAKADCPASRTGGRQPRRI